MRLVYFIFLVLVVFSSIAKAESDILREHLPLELVDDVIYKNHTFILVSGAHLSGTSTTERLLSSQIWASGLRPDIYPLADTSNCYFIDTDKPTHCYSPENEGSFLSHIWKNLSEVPERRCSVQPFFLWGHCANKQRLTERDLATLKVDPITFRRHLLRDWGLFWNIERPYLVQKDIPNTVQSRFLQSLLGPEKTYFIFSIRHPMAACKFFVCDYLSMMIAWIRLYETLSSDLEFIQNYLVLHQEIYFINGTMAIEELKQFLGWSEFDYIDGVEPHVKSGTTYFSTPPKEPRNSYPPLSSWNKSEYLRTRSKNSRGGEGNVYGKKSHAGLKVNHNMMDSSSSNDSSSLINHRKLYFHSLKNSYEEEDYTLILENIPANAKWNNEYPTLVKSKVGSLIQYEPILNRFCYTIYHLQPICNRPYWKRSY